jgi:hypothetical protein
MTVQQFVGGGRKADRVMEPIKYGQDSMLLVILQ